jgi:hypothetical protein
MVNDGLGPGGLSRRGWNQFEYRTATDDIADDVSALPIAPLGRRAVDVTGAIQEKFAQRYCSIGAPREPMKRHFFPVCETGQGRRELEYRAATYNIAVLIDAILAAAAGERSAVKRSAAVTR